MLVLSRKEGESVRLGDSIELVVVRISGSKIRLGIKTDQRVPILRGELVHGEGDFARRFDKTEGAVGVPEPESEMIFPSAGL